MFSEPGMSELLRLMYLSRIHTCTYFISHLQFCSIVFGVLGRGQLFDILAEFSRSDLKSHVRLHQTLCRQTGFFVFI